MTQSPMYPPGMADLPRRNEAVDHVDHVGCQLCGCGKAHPTPHKSRLQSRPRNATASVAKGSNDYISRRATGIQRLRKEVVNLNTIPDVEGYFFLQYNLTAEHKERVLGAMRQGLGNQHRRLDGAGAEDVSEGAAVLHAWKCAPWGCNRCFLCIPRDVVC